MTNALKVQKLAITAFVAVVMAFLFLNLFTVQAHAAGLLDETIDTAHEFSRYPTAFEMYKFSVHRKFVNR